MKRQHFGKDLEYERFQCKLICGVEKKDEQLSMFLRPSIKRSELHFRVIQQLIIVSLIGMTYFKRNDHYPIVFGPLFTLRVREIS